MWRLVQLKSDYYVEIYGLVADRAPIRHSWTTDKRSIFLLNRIHPIGSARFCHLKCSTRTFETIQHSGVGCHYPPFLTKNSLLFKTTLKSAHQLVRNRRELRRESAFRGGIEKKSKTTLECNVSVQYVTAYPSQGETCNGSLFARIIRISSSCTRKQWNHPLKYIYG